VWVEGKKLPVPFPQVHALAFSPDGKTLAVGGGTPGEFGALCLLDWPSGKLRERRKQHTDLIVGLAFSPDGKTLATASHDGTARFGERKLEGHAGQVLDFALLGTELLTACTDGSLRVFEASSGKLVRTLSQHTDRLHALALQPSSPRCATASADKTIRLWQPSIGRMIRIVRGFEGSVLCLAFSPDGTRLYTGGEEGAVRVIEADSDRILAQWKVTPDWLLRLVVSPDGKTLATGDSAGTVRRWDALTGAPLPSPLSRASGAGKTQRP
jgi:WD40 repeat protein